MRVIKETVIRPNRWVLPIAITGIAVGLWVAMPRTKPDPDAIWRQAESDFQSGRHALAEAALPRLKSLRAPTPLDHLLTAQVAMLRKRDDEALAELAAIPDDHQMGTQARLLAGQLELRRGRVRFAERHFKDAVKLDPKLVQAHRELIYIYGILLRRRELNAEFLALSSLGPMTFENVWHWCLTRNTVWEARELTEHLGHYVNADPDDRMSRIALAENYRTVGRRAEAEAALAPLPKSDPDALALRAKMALDQGDDLGAEKILAQSPADHAELSRLRGRLALARRDGQNAVKHFRAAYRADPDHRDALLGLGQALVMVDDDEAAAPFIILARNHDLLGTLMQRVAVQANRKDPALMRALGLACERIHRIPEARAWYQLAIDLNPLDDDAQKALFRLRTLNKPPNASAP